MKPSIEVEVEAPPAKATEIPVEVSIGIGVNDDGSRSVVLRFMRELESRYGVYMTPNRARLYGDMLIRCAESLEDDAEWESEDA